MLVFDILVDNLTLKTDGYPRLERTNTNVSAHLMIEFPPQSFGEEAFLEVSAQSEPSAGEPRKEVTAEPAYPPKNVAQSEEAVPSPLPSSHVRMSGRSRLAFLMPAVRAESSIRPRRRPQGDAYVAPEPADGCASGSRPAIARVRARRRDAR